MNDRFTSFTVIGFIVSILVIVWASYHYFYLPNTPAQRAKREETMARYHHAADLAREGDYVQAHQTIEQKGSPS